MDEEKIVNHTKYLYPYILRDLDSGFSGLILSSKHKSKVLTLFSESVLQEIETSVWPGKDRIDSVWVWELESMAKERRRFWNENQ